MKITLASYHTVKLRHGGPRTQIHQTKKYLEQEGIDVTLMDMWGKRRTVLGKDLFHLFASNFGTYDLARYLHAHEIKYVVSPIFFTRRSPWTIKTTCWLNEKMSGLAPGLWSDYRFAQHICKWASHCLPNTSAERHLLVTGLGASVEKVTMIPNGVEDRFLYADPELFYKEYGVKDFILHVGHIGVERKNTLRLMKAVRNLNTPAVFIGHIYPSKEAMLCLKEAEQNKNILIIRGLDHDSPLLVSAYAACSVFALPAKYETPGIAALEAGLAGAKVVITPHGGTTEYFEDMATYVNPYSISSIQKGIELALNQESNDTLKRHIQNSFLWQTVAAKTAEVYNKILNEVL